MNEEIKKKMIEYFEAMEVAAGKFGDLAQQEIPLVLQEYLNWQFYSNLFLGIGWFVLLGLFFAFFKRLADFAKKEHGYESPEYAFSIIIAIVSLLIGTGVLFGCSYQCVKVSVAPRVVILEKVGELANGN